MDSTNKPKTERVYDLFLENQDKAFDKISLSQLYAAKYQESIDYEYLTVLMIRLYRAKKLLRTKTQLNTGYFYTFKNQNILDKLYDHYLLPYDFANQELRDLITLDSFEKLRNDFVLNLNKLDNKFLKKHKPLGNEKVEFLAKLVAFVMGDGHLKKDKQNIYFYFKDLEDANKFVKDFTCLFNREKAKIKKAKYCYEVLISNTNLSALLADLGAPIGNKVLQPFTIPNWIFNGPDSIKLAFLSVIYGNEGSKPQNNKWRIQFVISKNKENVKNLLLFLNQIRSMLHYFKISASFIQLRKQKRRHFCGRFYIKGKQNLHKFYKLLEFSYASEKQRYLEALILTEKSPEV